MKKSIVTLVFACFLGTMGAAAQEEKKEPTTRENRTEKLVKDLGLNEAQTKEFKVLIESSKPTRNADSSEKPSREEMQKKREETEAKIKKLLTEEQYKKYTEIQKKEREARQGQGQRQRK